LGGDFYDIIALPNNAVAFVLADVTGHDLTASFIATICKMLFRQAFESLYSPNQVVSYVNKQVAHYLTEGRFVTAVVCVVDPDTHQCLYSAAGHIEQLLHQANGALVPLHAKGAMLGLDPSAEYIAKKLQLSVGDKLVLFTDGVLDCCNKNYEQFGKKRFYALVTGNSAPETGGAHTHASADSLVNDFTQEFEKFTANGTRSDDVTLLVVHPPQPSSQQPVAWKGVLPDSAILHAGIIFSVESFAKTKEKAESFLLGQSIEAELSERCKEALAELFYRIESCADLCMMVNCEVDIWSIHLEVTFTARKSQGQEFSSKKAQQLGKQLRQNSADLVEWNREKNTLSLFWHKRLLSQAGLICARNQLYLVRTTASSVDAELVYKHIVQRGICNVDPLQLGRACAFGPGGVVNICSEVAICKQGIPAGFSLTPAEQAITVHIHTPLSIDTLYWYYIFARLGITKGVSHTDVQNITSQKVGAYRVGIDKLHASRTLFGIQTTTHDTHHARPGLRADGSVDFKNLKLFTPIASGEVLQRIPAALRAMPQLCTSVRLQTGIGTSLSDDGMQIIATRNGLLHQHDGVVSVLDTLHVEGDVDYVTGSIDFCGNISVTGNVKSGFDLQAGGWIEVAGDVGACKVRAEGNIIIKGVVRGKNRAIILNSGSVELHRVEHAQVQAQEEVKLSSGLYHSQVVAQGRVWIAAPGNGVVVGSTIQSPGPVHIWQLEGDSAATSQIYIPVDLQKNSEQRIGCIKSELQTLSRDIEEIKQKIKTKNILLKRSQDKAHALLEEIAAAYEAYRSVVVRKSDEQNKLIEAEKRLYQLRNNAVICVHAAVGADARITIGQHLFVVQQKCSSVQFSLHENGIQKKEMAKSLSEEAL